MQGIIISRFEPVRTVLMQLIECIDPGIILKESSNSDSIESIIQIYTPDFIFMSLPPEADGGFQQAEQIKSNFPHITLVVIVSYDYPEYSELTESLGIDYFLSQDNMDRQVIQQIVERAKAGC